jgi:hypothetical protein
MYFSAFVTLLIFSGDRDRNTNYSEFCQSWAYTIIYGLWALVWLGMTFLITAEYSRGMCEKWWCEFAFWIGNDLALVFNIILLLVAT